MPRQAWFTLIEREQWSEDIAWYLLDCVEAAFARHANDVADVDPDE